MLFSKEMESPVGKLKLVAGADALVAILWERERPNRIKLAMLTHDPQQPILIEIERQLKEYFAGTRNEFNLTLEPAGTEFQKKVWQALRQIPYGQTRTYLDLAKSVGSARAARAVGAAGVEIGFMKAKRAGFSCRPAVPSGTRQRRSGADVAQPQQQGGGE